MEIRKYGLGETVKMILSEEEGQIIGLAEYLHSEPQYLVRHKASDGRQVDGWRDQSAVTQP